MSGEGLRHTADPAPEVQSSLPVSRVLDCLEPAHELVHLDHSRLEELADVPAAEALARQSEDGPEGILPPERLPIGSKTAKV
jgi:hypothetical protein